MLRAGWLADRLWGKLAEAAGERVDKDLRVFLLYFFCHVPFPTANTQISLAYLQFVADLDVTREYTWGAAALAFLHHQFTSYR